MKRTVSIAIVLVAIALMGLPSGARAKAEVYHFRDRVDLEGIVVETPEGCEDLIHVDGTLNIFVHTTKLDEENMLVVAHYQPQGAVTQGMESGNLYRGVGVTQIIERTMGPGSSTTAVGIFYQVPYVGVRMFLHTTVNANGEVTSSIERMETAAFYTCAE
jgi:hypothetical protein